MKVKLPSRRAWTFAALASGVALGLPLVFHPEHHHEAWWTHIPGFFAGYGFLGCVAIVLVSKWLGRLFLQKHGNFYDG